MDTPSKPGARVRSWLAGSTALLLLGLGQSVVAPWAAAEETPEPTPSTSTQEEPAPAETERAKPSESAEPKESPEPKQSAEPSRSAKPEPAPEPTKSATPRGWLVTHSASPPSAGIRCTCGLSLAPARRKPSSEPSGENRGWASALPRVRRRTGEPSSGTRNNWPT